MTPQQVVGLAVRIFSVWLLVRGIYQLALLDFVLREPNAPRLGYVVAPFAYLVAAVVLWAFPMAIAHRLVPRTKYQDVVHVQVRQAAVVACCVLGLWFIGQALPQIVRYLLLLTITVGDGRGFGGLDTQQHFDFIEAAIEFAVGIVLVIKARWVATRMLILARARSTASPT